MSWNLRNTSCSHGPPNTALQRRPLNTAAPFAFVALALWLPTAGTASEALEPCEAEPDEYFQALDSLLDSGAVGRKVASYTAVPFQAPERGIRVLELDGAYTVRVTVLEGELFNAYYYEDKATVPARVNELPLEPVAAKRIAAAVAEAIIRARPSDALQLPDNPIIRFSSDGSNCGTLAWDPTDGIPEKLVGVFMNLENIARSPRRKQARAYERLERLLTEIETASARTRQ